MADDSKWTGKHGIQWSCQTSQQFYLISNIYCMETADESYPWPQPWVMCASCCNLPNNPMHREWYVTL
jgi:hypothetical protein